MARADNLCHDGSGQVPCSTLRPSRADGACRKITDTIRGGQRSLEFCPPTVALQPRKVQSDSQEQMKGRWAGGRLAVSSSWNLFLGQVLGKGTQTRWQLLDSRALSQRPGAHTAQLDQPRPGSCSPETMGGTLAVAGDAGERLELPTSQGYH